MRHWVPYVVIARSECVEGKHNETAIHKLKRTSEIHQLFRVPARTDTEIRCFP